MQPLCNVVLGTFFVTWAIACYHVILAHLLSPGSSAFRPFWKNRYLPASQPHLRWFYALAVISVALALFWRLHCRG